MFDADYKLLRLACLCFVYFHLCAVLAIAPCLGLCLSQAIIVSKMVERIQLVLGIEAFLDCVVRSIGYLRIIRVLLSGIGINFLMTVGEGSW